MTPFSTFATHLESLFKTKNCRLLPLLFKFIYIYLFSNCSDFCLFKLDTPKTTKIAFLPPVILYMDLFFNESNQLIHKRGDAHTFFDQYAHTPTPSHIISVQKVIRLYYSVSHVLANEKERYVFCKSIKMHMYICKHM